VLARKTLHGVRAAAACRKINSNLGSLTVNAFSQLEARSWSYVKGLMLGGPAC